MALLRAAETGAATIELHRASLLQPESLEYALCASWAEARCRSEIPSEADQRALLEIAQRAKRRDPLFAFASYVLGQLALWAGDDVTAKKWFYEALRLDPTSEAGREVRILARREARTLGSSGTAEPSRLEPTTDTAPIVAPERTNRWARWLLPGAAVLATAAFLIFGAARNSVPRAERAAGSPLPPVDPEPKNASASPDGSRGGPTAATQAPKRRAKQSRPATAERR